MLTAEDNDLLCRVEGDAPMGRLMRAPLDSRLPVRGSRRARRRAGAHPPARRRAGRLSRQRRAAGRARRALPASPRVARARPQRGMRAALPLPRLEDRRRRQHRRAPVGAARPQERIAAASTGPIRAAKPAASSGCGWAIPMRRRHSSRRRGRPRPAFAPASSRCTSTATGRRCSKARSTRRTARACTRPTWCRRRVDGDGSAAREWLRPSTDKAPRLHVERTRFRLPLRRDPPSDRERGHARLPAHHAFRRAVHRAHPAERPLQPVDPQHSAGRHAHDVLLHRLERQAPASTRTRGASSAARRSASTSTRSTAASARATTTTCRTGRR